MAKITKIAKKTTAEEIIEFYKTDLTGKVAIVTGSNSGIGLETARVIALAGAKVIIPCRTMQKAHDAIAEIKKTVPNADLVPLQLDLSELSMVHNFVKNFLALDLPLHILINNAGLLANERVLTKDGFESTYGVNYVGPFLLVDLLTEKIKASAPSRIVIVSSGGQSQFISKDGINFDNLNSEKYFSSMGAYVQSKLCNIYHAKELQRRFDTEGVDVTVTSLHPGSVVTNLGRSVSFSVIWDIISCIRWNKIAWDDFKSVQSGASTNVYCAVGVDIQKGGFYANNALNTSFLNEQAENVELQKKLWDLTVKYFI